MRYLLSILLICITDFVKAQQQYNLVPNNSFEVYSICPNFFNSPPPPPWYIPSNYGNLYFNSCSSSPYFGVPYNSSPQSYQIANNGNAYIGLFFLNAPSNNLRNYFAVKLYDSLKAGRLFYVEFYVSLQDRQKLACNNISSLLSKTAQYVDTFAHPDGVLPATAQIYNYGNPIIGDTLNWVKVSSIFKAQGGEQYLTIGNFKYDTATDYAIFQTNGYNGAGYYVDDVSVIPLDSFNLKADAGRDTTITIGDSAFIGGYTNGIDTLRWQILGTSNTIDSLRPGFWVKPLVNTCYILTQTVNGFTSSDTVCINVNPLPLTITNYELRIINEQSLQGTKQSIINLWQTANEINVSHFNVQRSTNGIQFENIGQVKAHNNNLNEYEFIDNNLPLTVDSRPLTLYYRIESIDKDGKKQYSEVRNLELGIRNSRIVVYPNPAKDMISIQSTEGIKTIQLFDMFGREISLPKIRNQNNGNNFQFSFNIQPYSRGFYILKVITNKGNVVTEKLIIQ